MNASNSLAILCHGELISTLANCDHTSAAPLFFVSARDPVHEEHNTRNFDERSASELYVGCLKTQARIYVRFGCEPELRTTCPEVATHWVMTDYDALRASEIGSASSLACTSFDPVATAAADGRPAYLSFRGS